MKVRFNKMSWDAQFKDEEIPASFCNVLMFAKSNQRLVIYLFNIAIKVTW